jgi:hypothetical protein
MHDIGPVWPNSPGLAKPLRAGGEFTVLNVATGHVSLTPAATLTKA